MESSSNGAGCGEAEAFRLLRELVAVVSQRDDVLFFTLQGAGALVILAWALNTVLAQPPFVEDIHVQGEHLECQHAIRTEDVAEV